MKQEKVSVKIVPDTRRLKHSEQFPLKLRITYKGERKYFATSYDVTEAQWIAMGSNDVKGELRKIKHAVTEIEIEASKCCDAISPFSFTSFEHRFFKQQTTFQNIESAFKDYIAGLKKNEQFGSATNYQTSLGSLLDFKKNLRFQDITPDFLHDYEKWMLEKGKSITTVGIYVRNLRCIINVAKENGIVRSEDYPFGRRRYVIPTGRNVKKALDITEIKKIFDFVPDLPEIEKAKDFWMFTYLCNGINMMDIAQIKNRDIHKDCITFIRQKTKRTRRGDPILIAAPRNKHLDAIIKKYGSRKASDEYLFDIVDKYDNAETIRLKVQQFTKVNNKWTKRMGELLKLDMPLTTYVARHSYATILVRNGAPLTMASQGLGHTSVATTEKYFAGFTLSEQAKFAKALINF